MRYCVIESASIEDRNGAGDGAYDLLDQQGNPDEIGQAIADSLKEADLFTGGVHSRLDGGSELYMNVRIKFALHPVESDDG